MRDITLRRLSAQCLHGNLSDSYLFYLVNWTCFVQDDVNEIERKKLEAAREAYIIAVAGVKEKQDEESIAAAANARLHLQSLVLKQT